MDGDPTPALTGRRRTRPTSPGCRNPQQPEPGRAPLISAKPAVQSNRATSVHPVRYSGSFGFDFVALDGFPNPAGSGASRPHGVRLAFADIPTPVADELSDRIARWWRANILSQPSRRRVA